MPRKKHNFYLKGINLVEPNMNGYGQEQSQATLTTASPRDNSCVKFFFIVTINLGYKKTRQLYIYRVI